MPEVIGMGRSTFLSVAKGYGDLLDLMSECHAFPLDSFFNVPFSEDDLNGQVPVAQNSKLSGIE